MSNNFQERLLAEMKIFFEPFIRMAEDGEILLALLERIGWDVESIFGSQITEVLNVIGDIAASIEDIQKLIDSPPETLSDLQDALDTIQEVVKAIHGLSEVPQPGTHFDNIVELPGDLLRALIVLYVLRRAPKLFQLLLLLGILRLEDESTEIKDDTVVRFPSPLPTFDFNKVSRIINDPMGELKALYAPNGLPTHDEAILVADRLFPRLAGVLGTIGFESLVGLGGDTPTTPEEAIASMLTTKKRFILSDGSRSEFGLTISLIPVTSDGPGVFAAPFGVLSYDLQFEAWKLALGGEADIDGVFIKPDGVTFVGASSRAQIDLKIEKGTTEEAAMRIGSTRDSRLEIGNIAIRGTIRLETSQQEYDIVLDVADAKLVIMASDADSFLRRIVPPDGFSSEFGFGIGWSSLDGFYFRGSAALEVTIPVHKSIGPVDIHSVYVAIGLEVNTITTTLATSISAKIGPVDVSIDRIGIRMPIGFPENRDGNLGPINLEVPQFHPPKGAGLSIETDAFTGAGYLDFDEENQRYVGMLQIEASGYGVSATGLITTEMPDGSSGFSMLAIIAVEFNPGISLGAGFFLEGVGGLIGIHRSMLVDNIRQGIRDRSIDSILYPEDIVLNASRIISDLRGTFPPTEGRYVFGPIARITFAHYVQGEIGFMIEVPGPIRPVMMGQTALVIEKDDYTLVEIHEDVLGTIDFAKKTISYDASIYDSSLLIFSLTGDSAFRLSWGDQPNFALAIGGLNPRYTPPPNFPNMNRLRLSLGYQDIVRLNLDIYLAITSNSFHHGAKVEVSAEKGKFSLHGYLSFDTLINFSPFFFVADAGCGVAIKLGNKTITTVQLDLSFSGPQPWQVAGKAKFKCLGIKKSISVNATWGGGAPATLKPVDPWPLLKTALEDSGNWEAKVPESTQTAVALRKPKITSEESQTTNIVVLHPMAGLEIRQRVLPFNMEMDLFGNAPIAGEKKYHVVNVLPNGSTEEVDYGKDYFARAQFQSMSDDAKLSLPAFEKLDASIRLGVGEVDTRQPVSFPLTYETKVIDDNRVTREERDKGRNLPWRSASFQLAGSAARTAVISTTRLQAYAHPGTETKVMMAEEVYGIVGTTDMSLNTAIEGNDGNLTHAEAMGLMQNHLANHPEEIGNVQVAPSYEVAA